MFPIQLPGLTLRKLCRNSPSGPQQNKLSLIPFIDDNIQPGSTVITDCWNSYNILKKHEYSHQRINFSESKDPAHVHLPDVHRIASLLKRLLLSTHQGAVSSKHLDYYLDEHSFHFNRRTSMARWLIF